MKKRERLKMRSLLFVPGDSGLQVSEKASAWRRLLLDLEDSVALGEGGCPQGDGQLPRSGLARAGSPAALRSHQRAHDRVEDGDLDAVMYGAAGRYCR